MKTSAESLLITISNARRARQTREGERIKGESEGGREVGGGGKEESKSGLSCAEARIAKLNEHEICTVSGRALGAARDGGIRVRPDFHVCVALFCMDAGPYMNGTPVHVQVNERFLHASVCVCVRVPVYARSGSEICMCRSVWVCGSSECGVSPRCEAYGEERVRKPVRVLTGS